MPKQYEKIRDALVAEGKPLKEAKSEAAAIYNTQRKSNPKLPPLTNKPDNIIGKDY